MNRRARQLPAMILGLVAVHLVAGSGAHADVSGTVVDDATGDPLVGATVRVQAMPTLPAVTSAADGSFTLPVAGVDPVRLAASLEYDVALPVNYLIGGATVPDQTTDAEIRLRRLPATDNPAYAGSVPQVAACAACHWEQAAQWSGSVHAGAGTDAWVRDLFSGDGTPGGSAGYVFTDTHDPGETGFCATCHTPMADVFDPGGVALDEVTDPAALEGVSCIACHQVAEVTEATDGLHHVGNSSYRFPDDSAVATRFFVWGALDDVTSAPMQASHAPVFARSRFCASCHEYTNPFTGAPGQTTYTEWLGSSYAQPGAGFRSCQDCHMQEAAEPGTLASTSSVVRPPSQRHDHDFPGSTPDSLAAAIELELAASQSGDAIQVRSEVTNRRAGHDFPTGVSVRNALLVVTAELDGQPLSQTTGPVVPWWASDDVPGVQDGDWAGFPGTGFARVLRGRINGAGPPVEPVLFIDAESVASDTSIPAGATDLTEVGFALPDTWDDGAVVQVRAVLLYRRAWRALAVTKGWTQTPQGGPVEIEVARRETMVEIRQPATLIPVLGLPGIAMVVLLIGGAGWLVIRRRPAAGDPTGGGRR